MTSIGSCARSVKAFCKVFSAVVFPLKGIPTSITLCLGNDMRVMTLLRVSINGVPKIDGL